MYKMKLNCNLYSLYYLINKVEGIDVYVVNMVIIRSTIGQNRVANIWEGTHVYQ